MARGVAPRFVGREAELRALDEALAALCAGRPAVVLVTGEPGIGKTSMLEAAAARSPEVRRLHLAGFEPARAIPLAAATDLFRVLVDTSPAGGSLGAVLFGGGVRSELRPIRVFEATRVALCALAPVLLVVDDLQWADAASLALCQHVARAAAADGAAVGLVCASRPGPHLAAVVQGLRDGVGDLVEISLGPLDPATGVDLARSLDPGLTEDAARQLYDAASGSPFWIDALSRRSNVPGAARDVVSQRLVALSGDAAECLEVLVVAARPLTRSDLAAVLGWAPARTAAAAAALLDRGLAVAAGPSLQVVHDLVRETAYRQIPEQAARRLHRRLAAWLEEEAGDDLHLLMEALSHRVVLGAPPLDLALRIARSPQRRLLGADHLGRLAAIADDAASDDADALALQVEVATITSELGDREAAYNRWSLLSDRLTDPVPRARAALNAAREAIDLQRSADAAHMIERARSLAADDPWVGIEATGLDHARRMWVDGDLSGARPDLLAAVEEARRLVRAAGGVDRLDGATRRAYVEVLTAAWDVALTGDDPASMLTASDERVAATRGLGEAHLIAQADAARMLWWQDRWPECASRLAAVVNEARRQVYPALLADLCHLLAYTEVTLGDLEHAVALLDEAEQIESRLAGRTRRSVPWICGGLRHMVDASLRDWRAALGALRARAAVEPGPHARLRLHQWAALGIARFGGIESADIVAAETEAALADAAAAGCLRCARDVALSSAECFVRIGALDRAAEQLRAWDDAHRIPHGRFDLERAWAGALLAGALQRDGALADLEQVVAQTQLSRRRLDEVWARIDLGRAQAATDVRAAAKTLAEALAIAKRIGAVSEAQLVQRELRAVGVRTPGRARADATETDVIDLTPRELDVAKLVAAGRRNADVAAALFLSPKTVERHLSSIFTKLDVRSRAELVARYATRLGVDGG